MQTLKYFTAAQVARKIDQPAANLLKKIHVGEIQPDSQVGRFFLFNVDRIPEIQRFFQPQNLTVTH